MSAYYRIKVNYRSQIGKLLQALDDGFKVGFKQIHNNYIHFQV